METKMEIVSTALIGLSAGLAWCDLWVIARDDGMSYEDAQLIADEMCLLELAPESNPPGELLAA
jgi:hypothetical protein